VSGNPKIDLRE